MLSRIKFFLWKITHKKMLKELHKQFEVSVFQETNQCELPGGYSDYLLKYFKE